METLRHGITWAATFTALGAVAGVLLLLAATPVVHRLVARLTPDIDEDKELVRGNRAVAEYYGRVVSASIIGTSLIIAAAILAGIHG